MPNTHPSESFTATGASPGRTTLAFTAGGGLDRLRDPKVPSGQAAERSCHVVRGLRLRLQPHHGVP
eukprot:2017510-Heterocapsa_arctica.AAC.1